MTSFLAALALHYACDAAARRTMLSQAEAAACSQAYETVKLRFLTPEETAEIRRASLSDRAGLMALAYQRFKAWEASNPEDVQRAKRGILGELA